MNGNEIQKVAIRQFWDKFGGWRPGNIGLCHTKADKLKALKEMADLKIPFKSQTTAAARRQHFNEVKWRLCRAKIGSPCFACGKPGFARHHIIQIKHGGINSRRNLVILCDPCHAEIHPCL